MIVKLLVYSILAVSGLTLIKVGSASTTIEIAKGMLNFNLSVTFMLGFICYVLSFFTWMSLVRDNELSYIFPVANGIVTVTTILMGIMILHETVKGMQWLGIAFILIGITIVNMYK